MVRGARIDLETSQKAVLGLEGSYVRDLESRALSNEVIAGVNTIVRSLEGAMGKTAYAVYKRFATKKARTYFPLANSQAEFEPLLERNIPGLRAHHPEIADAFGRHQPYQPGKAALAHLKQLYRENHHHDFTMQERRDATSHDLMFGGMVVWSMGTHGVTIGGPPAWRGIPIEQELTESEGAPHERVGAAVTTYVDWHFVDPPVSVLGTLRDVHDLCVLACSDISDTAGL